MSYRIYGNDHLPPHFHVIGADVDAIVSIDPVTILRGKLPADLRKVVFAWASANREQLTTEWNAWNPNMPMDENGYSYD